MNGSIRFVAQSAQTEAAGRVVYVHSLGRKAQDPAAAIAFPRARSKLTARCGLAQSGSPAQIDGGPRWPS